MTSQLNRKQMRQLAEQAATQKEKLLDAGGYMPIPNDMIREIMPLLVEIYGARDGSDAVLLWSYLRAYAHGDPKNEFYMWSYPTRERIISDTGIGKNRLSRVMTVLEREGLLVTTLVSRPGKPPKRFFLTLI